MAVPRWLISVYGLVFVIVMGAGISLYREQEDAVREAAAGQLDAIARLKVGQILFWRSQQVNVAADLAGSALFVAAAERWLTSARRRELEILRARLEGVMQRHRLADIRLVDAAGRVRLSLAGGDGSVAAEVRQALDGALRGRVAVLSDLYERAGGAASRPALAAVAPLVAGDGRSLGAVVLDIDARDSLFPIVQSWPTSSASAETALVRREGDTVLFLNEVRHRADTALRLRIPLAATDVTAAMAARGAEGIVSGRDYRGVAVMAALQSIPGATWSIATAMDEAEAMGDWHVRATLILAFLLGVAATLAGSLLWLRRTMADRGKLLEAQAERADRAVEYRALFENAPVGHFLATPDGLLLQANGTLARMLGAADGDALVGAAAREADHPLAPSALRDIIAACSEDPADGGRHEMALRRLNGTPFMADVAVHVTADHLGSARCHGVVQDISDRKRMAELLVRHYGELEELVSRRTEELRISEAHRAIALSAAGAGSWDWNVRDGKMAWEAFDRLLGYAPGEVEPGYGVWAARVHPDDLAATEEKIRAAVEGRAPTYAAEYRVIWPDGSEHWIAASGRMAADADGCPHMLGVGIDITQRRQQAAELEARVRERTLELQLERDFVDTIFGVAPMPVVVLDRAGRIVRFNKACERLTGFSLEEVAGRPWHAMVAGDGGADLWEDFVARADICCPTSFEATWQSRDGTSHLIEWHNACLCDASGRVSLLVGIGIDITGKRRMEKEARQHLDELAQMHRLNTMGELAALLAHQLNQPLGAARSFAEAGLIRLRGKAVDPEQASHTLLRVVEQTERAAQVIRDLRRFLAKQPQESTLHDINAAARKACQLMKPLARGRRIDIRLALAEALPQTRMRPAQIEQVLINLLHNAIEAIGESGAAGGSICVGSEWGSGGGALVVSVRDSGPGLEAERVTRVFEPLYTTKKGGIGMGLSISRSIIADHGGRIWAEAGSGGHFRIELPVTP